MKNAFRNWSDIRVFLAVVREGSTLAASRKLGMAQPTVARRIEALEHEIGIELFVRDTRGFQPTQDALTLLPGAEAIEAACDGFAQKARDITQPRPIRITGFAANLASRVTDIFNEFSELHPEIQLELLPGLKLLDLSAGEADVALRLTWSELDPELICRHISTARFTLYGTPEYAERHGLPSCPEEMKDHAIFTFKPSSAPHILHNWLLEFIPPDGFCRTFSEVSVMDAAIRSGQGLGMLNLRMSEAEEKAGTLIRCFEPPEALRAPHVVLISPQAYRRPEVKTFTKFFIPRYAKIFK